MNKLIYATVVFTAVLIAYIATATSPAHAYGYTNHNYNTGYGNRMPHYNAQTFSYLPAVVQGNWAVQEHYFGNDGGYGSINWTDVQIPSRQIYSQNISQNESDNERYARYRAEKDHYKNFFYSAGGYTPPQQNMDSLHNRLYNHYYYDTRDYYYTNY